VFIFRVISIDSSSSFKAALASLARTSAVLWGRSAARKL